MFFITMYFLCVYFWYRQLIILVLYTFNSSKIRRLSSFK